ncbi:tRNA ligase [Nadsonia fulvescens var. elongata DSM 6958]|uniref:tRNA ligase n=1 Tax=Nadsonia fulvescens var. elongata DSM 6958 TaxID=857566 RepID=A0A1E3PGS9_9ASCO|nr:tRNA ligase [Nadsonia fulvescens var. elongata DSM 6958]
MFIKLHETNDRGLKKGRSFRAEYPIWIESETEPKDIVASETRKVTRWKFNEWDYGKDSIQLATNARGLFSMIDSNDGLEKIVIRGYDKFFNPNEVRKTQWSWIVENTLGPYEVTLKENGCIIFITGLSDGTLLVCSKHSTGPIEGKTNEKIHSYVGMKWVEKHLKKSGYTKQDLALTLYSMGVTAVGELCDDSFEEHILPYTGEKSGIYLHGLNLNTAKFSTYSCKNVEAFASKFGFLPTKYVIKDNITELKKFLDYCAETGSWAGDDIEGFVVRCKVKENPNDSFSSDYFFKYKFDEPYLMYRQWREITKYWLSGKPINDILIKKHVDISKRYLQWASLKLTVDPERAERYRNNQGIIELRDEFLSYIGKRGIEIINHEGSAINDDNMKFAELEDQIRRLSLHVNNSDDPLVIIPVATIGCGKTTLAVSLTKIFPDWVHIQSDDISGSGVGHKMVDMCIVALFPMNPHKKAAPVVIFDRNNHQFRERKQIFDDFTEKLPAGKKIKFVGLSFMTKSHPESTDLLWNVTVERVMSRGDNHQSIKSEELGSTVVEGIMKGFIGRYQPINTRVPPDYKFDLVIELQVNSADSSRKNLEKIVKAINMKYPYMISQIPAPEHLDAAVKYAIEEYKPTINKLVKGSERAKKKIKPSYFGVLIDLNREYITNNIENLFKCQSDVDKSFFNLLKERERVQKTFHITLVHIKNTSIGKNKSRDHDSQSETADKALTLEDKQTNLFRKLKTQLESIKGFKAQSGINVFPGTDLLFDVKFERLLWNDRVMTIMCSIYPTCTYNGLLSVGPCHITIGTADTSIRPVESLELLDRWLADQKAGINCIEWTIEPKGLNSQKLMVFI